MNKTVKALLVNTLIVALKDVPNLLVNKVKEQLINSVTIYRGTALYTVFEQWLYANYKHKFKEVEVSTGAFEDRNPPSSDSKVVELSYGLKEGYFYIKHDNKRLLISKSKVPLGSNSRVFLDYYTLSAINKTVINDLLQQINKEFTLTNTKAQLFTTTEWGEWMFMSYLKPKTMDSIILNTETKRRILDDFTEFIDSEEWYNEMGIDHRRGYLFYGKPGNGKTSLSIALAQKFKKDIYAIDLASINNDSYLKAAFKRLPTNCVLLIEDVDKAFIERESSSEVKGITFSCLLNCLNGVFQKEGVITIMTTNHIDKLDEALIRSGRIDLKIEIKNPDNEQISQYLSRFYKTTVGIIKHKSISMADLQDICIRNKDDVQLAISEVRNE